MRIRLPNLDMTALYRDPRLRRVALPLLAKLNPGDITIRHHWTGDPVRLHSFRHRSYWLRGPGRERAELLAMHRLVGPHDSVFDVGGHIGYTALFLASLARHGHVHVFEPGPNNLPYLRRNCGTRPNIAIFEHGVGAEPGTATLYVESLSGQNNSFVRDFRGLSKSSARSFVEARVAEVAVALTSIDQHVHDTGVKPAFIKVDVEGFEWDVLQGAAKTLAEAQPAMMVEVQACHAEIEAWMTSHGYVVLNAHFEQKSVPRLPLNTFFLHRDRHESLLDQLACPPQPE